MRNFDGFIEANYSVIHYSEGFLSTPGYVDVSGLVFTTASESAHLSVGPDTWEFFGDDSTSTESEEFEDDQIRRLDNDVESTEVELILFHEPKECSRMGDECDWSNLGVGNTDEYGGFRWCCSEESMDLGLCTASESSYGKLMLNRTLFKGVYRSLSVPSSKEANEAINFRLKYGKMDVEGESGNYILAIANCNQAHGRNMTVSGTYVWKSEHGLLPGDLFGKYHFNIILFAAYLLLLVWYAYLMKKYEDSAIPIEKYIFGTICMGTLECFFKTGDLWVWNVDGERFWIIVYLGVVIGVLKRATSRCLLVMVSLGWGVVRDDLGAHKMRRIYVLGGLYAVTSIVCDVLAVFEVVEFQTIGAQVEEDIFDIVVVLNFIVATLDVTFATWILDSMSGTMQYLDNMCQVNKMLRYERLRFILLLSIVFAIAMSVFAVVNNYLAANMLAESHQWAVQSTWEVNYLLILIGVSCLWRPNPSAREYAYVMELPSLGNNDDGSINFETDVDCYEDDEEDESKNDTSQKPKGMRIEDGEAV
eukprot:CAMPEP_0178960954 /NCGR_PEP_ID=MMETSP0789-20121207/13330_1 /TAXON_ID=3005 /ORGANISM="Rhizosolenia setigera, Strain CCMP 1694" /LENGTH=532 /DNA_ID=CAMNT_0020644519 /DNA_START=177 /DNA_END=1775 /DNA_ORIENTATION=-